MNHNRNNNILQWALLYAKFGWHVFPIFEMRGGKCACGGRPRCKPGKHPRTDHGHLDATTDPKKIKEWWDQWPNANIGIATGEVSGLLVIDVDPRNLKPQTLPDLSRKVGPMPECPMVDTGGGGWHNYFNHPTARTTGSRTGIAPGIDIKANGGYVIAPPSNHASGGVYVWRIAPERVALPDLSQAWLDLIDRAACYTEYPEDPGIPTKAHEGLGGGRAPNDWQRAIQMTLPTGPGMRHARLFDLVRMLKAMPEHADRPARDLECIVQEWHRQALPYIGTKDYDTTWFDFTYAWAEVKFPWGTTPMTIIFEQVKGQPYPPEADHYKDERLKMLVALCRAMQRHQGDKPFYLSTHDAGQLLGVQPMQVWRWMEGQLRADKVVHRVKKGDFRKKLASEYRYLGDL